ncbi:hypothetical protein [Longispora albida]|nr:hypothetical protein [Longispora albida]
MSNLMDKFRNRRAAHRRARAIERALQNCPSQSLRDELLTIANRY